MKKLLIEPIDHRLSSVIIETTGEILGAHWQFVSQEQQIFITHIFNDELPIRKFLLFIINQLDRLEIDITESLDINFKYLKTLQNDEGHPIHLFVKEITQED